MDEIAAGKNISLIILFPNAVLCNSHVFHRKYSYLNNTSGVDILCTNNLVFPNLKYVGKNEPKRQRKVANFSEPAIPIDYRYMSGKTGYKVLKIQK